jgi:hypothetical protein
LEITMKDILLPPVESVRFPEEQQAVAEIQKQYANFHGLDAFKWALAGHVQNGDITVAEISPTLRCPEACALCPDSSVLLNERISKGLESKIEQKVPVNDIQARISSLYEFGVRHFMFIGGTIDHIPELPELVDSTANLGQDVRISWFTDMITWIDEKTGKPNPFFAKQLEHGWIKHVATHVSMDYPYNGNVLAIDPNLPEKKGRSIIFKQDGDYSRWFKSQYGAVGAKRLIEANVRRVVVNITVGPSNLEEVLKIYDQVSSLQEFAQTIGSPTEVLLTFSPMIWRPHQARGDSPIESPAAAGLSIANMSRVNAIFSDILDDTYDRINHGQARLLANSSGYTHMMADPQYQNVVTDQDLPYIKGKPEMWSINPRGDILGDPMFIGPELIHISSIFGYRDRPFLRNSNPFTQFHPKDQEWFPNLVTT